MKEEYPHLKVRRVVGYAMPHIKKSQLRSIISKGDIFRKKNGY